MSNVPTSDHTDNMDARPRESSPQYSSRPGGIYHDAARNTANKATVSWDNNPNFSRTMKTAANTMHRKRMELYGQSDQPTSQRTNRATLHGPSDVTKRDQQRPPPGQGGGRTHRPLRIAHPSAGAHAVEANKPHHHSLPTLQRLGGDTHSPPWGTQTDTSCLGRPALTTTHHAGTPLTMPNPPHAIGHPQLEMDKTSSTDFIDDHAWAIYHKQWDSVTIKDFESPYSSDGKSLLLTMVVNQALAHTPGLTDSQLARIATHAAVRDPLYLLRCLTEESTASQFVDAALATRPIRLEEHTVCPMDTPYLISDSSLRDQLGSVDTTPPSDLRRICTPFLQCFYPANWEILEQSVRRITDSHLAHMISIPGALHDYFIQQQVECPFDPPRWVSLSHLRLGDAPDDWEEGSEMDDETCHVDDTSDYICPITEMGYTQETFDRLTPEQQKRTVLAKLPSSLATLISPVMLRWVMTEMRDMATPSIRGALEPSIFRQILNTAPQDNTTTSSGINSTYAYRFRIQNAGKGSPAWTDTSPGRLLRHWLRGWIPMFKSSDFRFTLTRQPSDSTQDPIEINALVDIPMDSVLEHYAFDTQIKKGKIIQFDIWFTSDCEDINNNGARSFLRNAELQDNYSKEVRGNFIWSMKMERLPLGLVPCIMLERSLLRDHDDKIEHELHDRAKASSLDIPRFAVAWITIGTSAKTTQVMIKCILASPTDHQRVSKLWTTFQGGTDEQYPTTFDYRPLVIPHPRTPAFDQELNQTIARHLTYIKSLTHTILLGLPSLDPFTHIPNVTLLSGLPDGQNKLTMAHLLCHGVVDMKDGLQLHSTVGRISIDMQGSRIYLHGLRTDAAKLLSFTREIAQILPTWLEDEHLEVKLDTSDADRASHSTPQSHSRSKQPKQAGIHPPGTQPDPQTAVLQIPAGEWNHAMEIIGQLSHRLAKMEDQVQNRLTTMEDTVKTMKITLEDTPTITTLRTTMDDVISTLTQTMTLTSDSIKEHTAHISSATLTSLTNNIDANHGHVLKLCVAVDNTIASSATTLTDALTKVSDIASTFTPSKTTNDTPAESVADPTPLKPVGPTNLSLQTSDITPPESLHTDTEVNINMPTAITDQLTGVQDSTSYDSPEEDLCRPRTAACLGCNKIDDNIEQCDRCELPYHRECLVTSPTGSMSRYCPDCIHILFPPEPPAPADHTPTAAGNGLTESSETATSDSDASEYEPKYKTNPLSNTTHPSKSHVRSLRPRTKR